MAVDYGNWAASGDEDASFDRAPFDHENARGKMIARITRTLKQLRGDKVAPQGGKDFEALHNNGVIYRPTLNGQPIKLPGLGDSVRISRSALQDKLPVFAKDVEAGHFDDQLEAVLSAATSTLTRTPKAAGATNGRNMSPEGRVNIAMNNRYNKDLSDSDLQAKLIEGGHDADVVKTAIKNRKRS